MIKFVSDLRQVGGFPQVLPLSSTNKTDYQNIAEILLKVALNTISLTHIYDHKTVENEFCTRVPKLSNKSDVQCTMYLLFFSRVRTQRLSQTANGHQGQKLKILVVKLIRDDLKSSTNKHEFIATIVKRKL